MGLRIPKPNEHGVRRYGQWAGNPSGRKENPESCVVIVPAGGRSPLFRQCRRKRGHGPDGLYCKQHAKKVE